MSVRINCVGLVAFMCLAVGVVASAGSAQSRGGSLGACCLPDGTCEEMFEFDCVDVDGVFQGKLVSCSEVTCPVLGACCLPNGSCVGHISNIDCVVGFGGQWQGMGTDCGPPGLNTVECEPFDSPPNDDCENALLIPTLNTPFPATVAGATEDEFPICGDSDRLEDHAGVWFTVVGNGSVLRATVCAPQAGTRGDDDFIAVFCGDCDDLRCIASNDFTVESCIESGTLLVDWCSELDRVYHIFVEVESVPTDSILIQVFDTGQPCTALPCIPANDDCENAIEIFTDTTVAGSTFGASLDQIPICAEPDGVLPVGVWYRIQGTGRQIGLEMCAMNEQPLRGGGKGPLHFGEINVYCGSCSGLVCVTGMAGDIFECDFATDRNRGIGISWCSEVDQTYYIHVNLDGADGGDFLLNVDEISLPCEPVPCGAADSCENAQLICPGEVRVGNTFSATSDYLDHGAPFDTIFFCGMFFGLYDVWYKYEPAEAGLLFVHVEGPPTEYVFGVYDSCSSLPEDLLACNIARHHGVVITWVQPGTTYYIRIAGYATTRGEFEIDLVGPDCLDDFPELAQ